MDSNVATQGEGSGFKEGDKFSGILNKLCKARYRRGFVRVGLVPGAQPWRKEPRPWQPLCAQSQAALVSSSKPLTAPAPSPCTGLINKTEGTFQHGVFPHF